MSLGVRKNDIQLSKALTKKKYFFFAHISVAGDTMPKRQLKVFRIAIIIVSVVLLSFWAHTYRIEGKSTRIDNISFFASMTVVVRQPGGQILSPSSSLSLLPFSSFTAYFKKKRVFICCAWVFITLSIDRLPLRQLLL